MIELSKKERKYLYKLTSSNKKIKLEKKNIYQEILISKGFAKINPGPDTSGPFYGISDFVEPTTEGIRYKSMYRENWRKELFKNILWPVIVSIIVALITTIATLMLKKPLKH